MKLRLALWFLSLFPPCDCVVCKRRIQFKEGGRNERRKDANDPLRASGGSM